MSRMDSPNGINRKSMRKNKSNAISKSTRVFALQSGMTHHRPSVLKEGYLHKPSFFRFGGKKRRWCVLRTYSSTEASLDIFLDDTKTRYKGTIRLDKEAEPILMIRNDESTANQKSSKLQSSYLVIRVGKNMYHFTTESLSELKEWCALIRQVIDSDGSLFSASVVEPNNASIEGIVNVQFTSNYIALICPVQEISLKRWRLEHITSFGQCGGILTFECCPRCSDPSANRCSLNIKQEKPATILSLMEKTVRENPNTNEIHYERSILGDIYHCSHSCGSPKLFSALSDPNLTRINGSIGSPVRLNNSTTSQTEPSHKTSEFGVTLIHSNTLDSNDSGVPGTPPQLEDSPRSSSILSSPSYMSNGKPSPVKLAPKEKLPSPPDSKFRHNNSSNHRYDRENTPGRETDDSEDSDFKGLTYSKIVHSDNDTNHSLNLSSSVPSSVIAYTKIKQEDAQRKFSTPTYNRLSPVFPRRDKNAPVPPERKESRFRTSSGSPPCIQSAKSLSPSRVGFQVPLGTIPPPPQKLLKKHKTEPEPSLLGMVRDCSEDRDQPVAASYIPEPPIRERSGTHFVQRELPPTQPRNRAQSYSDELSTTVTHPPPPRPPKSREMSKSTSDELEESHVHDQPKHNTLAELKSNTPFFRLDEQEYDETDNEGAAEVMSNLLDYERSKNTRRDPYCRPSVVDKVLSKVACDNVRGYAYQIAIPAVDVIYDVPRKEAPIPNTRNINRNGPPKPLRQATWNDSLSASLSQNDYHVQNIPTEA